MSSTYTVLSITELQRVNAAGNIEKYYRHKIITAGGTVLTVDIEEQDFTPEKAEPILTAAAQNADTIKAS